MVDDHDVDEIDYDHDGELQDGMTVRNFIANTYWQKIMSIIDAQRLYF